MQIFSHRYGMGLTELDSRYEQGCVLAESLGDHLLCDPSRFWKPHSLALSPFLLFKPSDSWFSHPTTNVLSCLPLPR